MADYVESLILYMNVLQRSSKEILYTVKFIIQLKEFQLGVMVTKCIAFKMPYICGYLIKMENCKAIRKL